MENLLESFERHCPQATKEYFFNLKKDTHENYHYLINLILDSPKLLQDSALPWGYKSLAQDAAESFARQPAGWAIAPTWLLRDDFLDMAAKVYGIQLYSKLYNYMQDEVKLYVLNNSNYVEGNATNDEWRFVYSLAQRDNDVERTVYSPPRWATELYLCRDNLRTVNAIFYDLESLPREDYQFGRNIKLAALHALYNGRLNNDSQVSVPKGCPRELSAAIEAFEAVRNDPKAQAGQSPKAAIVAWLKSNKPGLSEGARERIATVANWQPAGGAPKTPGT